MFANEIKLFHKFAIDMTAVNIKRYDIFRNDLHLPETKAKELVEAIDEAVNENVNLSKYEYESLWKDDFKALDDKISGIDKEVGRLELKMEQTKSELSKAIYVTGLIQFLAIVGYVVSLVSFMLRK